MRWWGIRHVRWFFAAWRFNQWWHLYGYNYWLTPNPADLKYLEDIWKGEA